MIRYLFSRHLLGDTRLNLVVLRMRKAKMQEEKALRAAILISKIRDTNPRRHEEKLRYAKKLSDIIGALIEEEAREATQTAKDDPAHLTWAQIADALEISKTAAFARYGPKKDERD